MNPAKLHSFIVGAIRNKRRVLVKGKPGIGKCLGKGTPVLLFDGRTVPVETIQPGDLLMGPDSNPRRVLATNRGIDQLFQITPTKGDSWVCNSEHILSVFVTGGLNGRKNTRATVNLSVAQYLTKTGNFKHHAKCWRTGVSWPTRAVQIDPYILGLWLGDGHSKGPIITNIDPEVLIAWKAYGEIHGLNCVPYDNDAFALTGTRAHGGQKKNPFTGELEMYGLIDNKHIPADYLFNNRETRLQLLAGLIDTDGCKLSNCFEISQENERIAQAILFLARSLGLAAYMKKTRKGCQTGVFGTYYRITISGNVSEIPVRIERKKATPRLQIKNVLYTGFDVKPIGEGEFFGFQLTGDGLFLLGDFTVTHNSEIVCQAAKECQADIVLMHPAISDPTDFKGMPALTRDGAEAHFLPFGDLSRLCHADKPTVAFLDDIGQANPAVQAALMQLILARSVNGTKLSDHVTFLGATNDTTHMAGVSGMIEPLKSRWDTIIDLEVSCDDLCNWGLDHNVSAEMIAFWRFRPALISAFKPTREISNSPSPRGWASVDKWLQDGVKELEVFQGAVGEGAATEFYAFLDMYKNLPSLDAILIDPKNAPVPEKPAQLFAVASGLARVATATNFERVTTYLKRLPVEYNVCSVRDAIRLNRSVTSCPAFVAWATKHSEVPI